MKHIKKNYFYFKIQNPRCKENFKLFLCTLTSRHCLILNDFVIMVVKTVVMACPNITNDQSINTTILEPSASLACQILHYLFTSAPKLLVYRRTSSDQRMITASLRNHSFIFSSFLIVLKCLFLLGVSKKDPNQNVTQSSSAIGQNQKQLNRNNSSSSRVTTSQMQLQQQQQQQAASALNNTNSIGEDGQPLELDQFAMNVLHEICEHDWIKERCYREGDNLLRPNQLLEPALNRRAQNLLHIICYPQNHYMRKHNEHSSSTKDFIRNILQNLNIWNLRESILEFKLMIELEKQKERYYEYTVECLAKTTVDFLIDNSDKEKLPGSSSSTNASASSSSTNLHHQSIQRSLSNMDNANNDDEMNVGSTSGPASLKSPPNSLKSIENPPTVESALNENGQSNQLNMDDIGGFAATAAAQSNSNDTLPDDNNPMSMQQDSQNDLDSKNPDLILNREAVDGEMSRDALIAGETFTNFDLNDDLDNEQQQCDEDIELIEYEKSIKHTYLSSHVTSGVWLVAPLINRLPCKSKVLDNAAKALQELGKSFWNAKNKIEKETQAIKNINAWNQQPFFSLLLECVKSKDDQRLFLTYLFNGLMEFINKDDKILSEDPRIKQIMIDTLHIRLSLVGSMFDFILRNGQEYANWAGLFVQLIYSGVVDPDNDQLLFTITIDMLAVLIHHVISLEPNLDNNKTYQMIVKKISKETKDFMDIPNTKSINHVSSFI